MYLFSCFRKRTSRVISPELEVVVLLPPGRGPLAAHVGLGLHRAVLGCLLGKERRLFKGSAPATYPRAAGCTGGLGRRRLHSPWPWGPSPQLWVLASPLTSPEEGVPGSQIPTDGR